MGVSVSGIPVSVPPSLKISNGLKKRNFRYKGSRMACGGIISVKIDSPNTRFRPKNRKRASP